MKTTELALVVTCIAVIGAAAIALLHAATTLTARLEDEADEDTTAAYLYSTELLTEETAQPTEPTTVQTTTEPATEAEPQSATPTIEADPVVQTESIIPDYAAEMIGRTIWGEAGGINSTAEQAAVAWCILNRVDARGQTIEEVVTAPGQFHGYRTWGECPQEFIDLAADVLTRWEAEKYGATDAGRVLPAEYMYFHGKGGHNHYRTEYKGDGTYWDWSLTDPYQ